MTLEFRAALISNGGFRLAADWTLPSASLTAVVGVSGSGKSTLLKALAGFLPVVQGEIRLDGTRIDHLPADQRPVTMVFQDNNLFPHLSAARNIALARQGLTDDEIAQSLARVGLDRMSARKPAQLSGGQQARVVLARSLLMARPLLLLDEPFAALGPGQRQDMLGLVCELAREQQMGVLMTTHQPRELDQMDHVVLVDAGVAQTPVARTDFLTNPPQVWRDYLGNAR